MFFDLRAGLRPIQGDENRLKGTAYLAAASIGPSVTEQNLCGFTGCRKPLVLYQGTTLVGA
jgi:hypothetical protein